MRRRRAAPLALVAVVVLTALAAAGCGEKTEPAAPELAVTGAWSRPTPAAADEAVVYLTLTTDRADALVGASVPASVAAGVELHEGMAGMDGSHHHGGGGEAGDDLATMAPVERFDLDPATPLTFEPGGNHLMLTALVEPLATGDRYELTLRFESGRTLAVDVLVQSNPPT